MATVRQTICDRCNKPIEYIGWTALVENVFKPSKLVHILHILNGNPDGYSYTNSDYELCAECDKKLHDFLRNKN